MKITLETTGKSEGQRGVVIKTEQDHHDIHEVWDVVIKPALIAYGFTEATVNELVDEIR